MKMKGVKNWRKAAKFLNAHVWKSDPTDLFSRTSYLAALAFTTVFENSTKCLIFSYVRAKRAAHGHIKKSFLKEIGILKHFVLRKSEKIGKIENTFHKRHLTISLILSFPMVFRCLSIANCDFLAQKIPILARFARNVVKWDFCSVFKQCAFLLRHENKSKYNHWSDGYFLEVASYSPLHLHVGYILESPSGKENTLWSSSSSE